MIRRIEIENFKSVAKVELDLGRVNVLIGENGSGKSNLLEAIAVAGAAVVGKLNHEFLSSRGIRPAHIRARFESTTGASRIAVWPSETSEAAWVRVEENAYGLQPAIGFPREFVEQLQKAIRLEAPERVPATFAALSSEFLGDLVSFLFYSPENTALRTFQQEGQILPLGIRGEGLFAHLRRLAERTDLLPEINRRLSLLDWFGGFQIPTDLGPGEHRLALRDRFLSEGGILDQRSANEGFLFLLFYYTLLISPDTPKFFAIDNIDASLNPKLCARLMADLVELAKAHDKQVILTTHNPAVLDGLNLTDDDQRLLVVSRDADGPTRVRRVPPPRVIEGAPRVSLSEAFLRGYLGGLPKNF